MLVDVYRILELLALCQALEVWLVYSTYIDGGGEQFKTFVGPEPRHLSCFLKTITYLNVDFLNAPVSTAVVSKSNISSI